MKKSKMWMLGILLGGFCLEVSAQEAWLSFGGKVTDQAGKGIAGVVVNDGVHFTKTDAQGVWSSVDDSECQQLVCPAMGELPETPAGTTLEVPCGEHYEGMMHGTCSIYGVWTSVDVTQCGRGGEKR